MMMMLEEEEALEHDVTTYQLPVLDGIEVCCQRVLEATKKSFTSMASPDFPRQSCHSCFGRSFLPVLNLKRLLFVRN